MSLLTRDEFKTLIQESNGPRVSIFMPTHRVGPEIQQDPIRLKNLLKQAEESLVAGGMRAPEARTLLEPARELLEDHLFWQEQNDGLALLLSEQHVYTYRLPLNFDELVWVGSHFYLKPLLPLLNGDGQFYVLALSQNEVKLWQATRYSISQVELPDMPTSLAEALQYEEPERQLQFHTATDAPQAPGDRTAMFHGHGVGTDDKDENLRRYLQKVAKGMQEFLQNDQSPLVLAGVEYLQPIYQEVNQYPHLLEKGITGSPDRVPVEELHQQAWAIVQPYFEQAQKEAQARYQELAHTDRATSDIHQIIPAAYYGRVDSLFVALGQQQWGTFDQEESKVHLHEEAQPDDEDLLETAATQTLLNGGAVYPVEPEQMPNEGKVAAIFRY